jgi:hypothetical protein
MIIIADEIIVFTTVFTIAIVWMFLKVLVNHLIDSSTPPQKNKPVRKAA